MLLNIEGKGEIKYCLHFSYTLFLWDLRHFLIGNQGWDIIVIEPNFCGIPCNLRDMSGVCFFPSFKYCLVQPLSQSLLTLSQNRWLAQHHFPRAVAELFPQRKLVSESWVLTEHSTHLSPFHRERLSEIWSPKLVSWAWSVFFFQREESETPPTTYLESLLVCATINCTHLSHPWTVTRFSFWHLLLSPRSCLWPTNAHPTQMGAVFPGTLCP